MSKKISAMNIGMVKEFVKLLDEAVAPVMVRVKMIESRNEILARQEVYTELGIDRLLKELEKAKATVQKIEEALVSMGLDQTYGRGYNQQARARLNNLIAERSKKYNNPEVAEFLATVAAAKENITLSCYPAEVRVVLQEVKEVSEALQPKLIAAEEKTLKLMKARKIDLKLLED